MRNNIGRGFLLFLIATSISVCLQSPLYALDAPRAYDQYVWNPYVHTCEAYKHIGEDPVEVLKCLIKKAEHGDASAENRLGIRFAMGEGVTQNYQVAVTWFLKSAEQRNTFAEYNLGWSYEKGLGVSQDYTKALKWYRNSASQKNPYAELRVGDFFINGLVAQPDYEEALKWYRKAQSHGYYEAFGKKEIADIQENMINGIITYQIKSRGWDPQHVEIKKKGISGKIYVVVNVKSSVEGAVVAGGEFQMTIDLKTHKILDMQDYQ